MLVDRIQRDFECCGALGPEDWLNASFNTGNKTNQSSGTVEYGVGATNLYTPKRLRLPLSCCKIPSSDDCKARTENLVDVNTIREIPQSIIYKSGCLEKFEDFIKEKWQWILITGGILIGVQVFALIFACVLCCAISRVGDK